MNTTLIAALLVIGLVLIALGQLAVLNRALTRVHDAQRDARRWQAQAERLALRTTPPAVERPPLRGDNGFPARPRVRFTYDPPTVQPVVDPVHTEQRPPIPPLAEAATAELDRVDDTPAAALSNGRRRPGATR